MGKAKKQKKFTKLRKLLSGGTVPETYTIYMDGKLSSDTPPTVRCTCEKWSFGPSENMMELSVEAKKHETENPGHNRRWPS